VTRGRHTDEGGKVTESSDRREVAEFPGNHLRVWGRRTRSAVGRHSQRRHLQRVPAGRAERALRANVYAIRCLVWHFGFLAPVFGPVAGGYSGGATWKECGRPAIVPVAFVHRALLERPTHEQLMTLIGRAFPRLGRAGGIRDATDDLGRQCDRTRFAREALALLSTAKTQPPTPMLAARSSALSTMVGRDSRWHVSRLGTKVTNCGEHSQCLLLAA
jgi:hypothetical protein